MIRVLVISLALLGSIVLQAGAAIIPDAAAEKVPDAAAAAIIPGPQAAGTSDACQLGTCSCTGDPHVTPFPSAYGQPQYQYWCQQPGWVLLLENPYVLIYILVDSAPYVVRDYVVIFPGASPCVLVGSYPGAQTCAAGTPATSVVSVSGQSWYHFDLTRSIVIEINQFSYLPGYRYDIYVTQPFYLIGQSTGVCIKPNCSIESPVIQPIPIAAVTCKNVIDIARKQALGVVSERLIRQAHTSCVHDVQLTLDPQFAQTAISVVLHSSITPLLTSGNLQEVVAKMDDVKQAVTATVNDQIKGVTITSAVGDPNQVLQQVSAS